MKWADEESFELLHFYSYAHGKQKYSQALLDSSSAPGWGRTPNKAEWWIFPVKKPLVWPCLITVSVLWGWKQTSTETLLGYFTAQTNLPFSNPCQPHGGSEILIGYNYGGTGQSDSNERRISSRDLRYKVWCARWKGICNMNKFDRVVHNI